MSVLGKAQGVFSLEDSDRYVGSFILLKDIPSFIPDLNFDKFNSAVRNCVKEVGGKLVVNELDLAKLWGKGQITNLFPKSGESLDELILATLIRKCFPDAIIVGQEKIGRMRMDLKVTVGETTCYIEFDGPCHFAQSNHGLPSKQPFDKKRIIEQKTGIEVVNWPYWIQRCERNARILFDPKAKRLPGYGALWSTKVLFGDFCINTPADVIVKMSSRFNAWNEETGVCDFYEKDSLGRIKPEHPILQKIATGKASCKRLLPVDVLPCDYHFWLPQKILSSLSMSGTRK